MTANKTLLILLTLSLGLIISCGGNSTGTDPKPIEPKEPNEPKVTTGILEITTSTTGNSTDEDGFTVTVGENESKSIGTDETITFEDLEEGSYSVELSGLGTGCSIDGNNPTSVEVVAEEKVSIAFEVTCEQSTAKGIIVFTQRVNGTSQIFTMNADGSHIQRITNTNIEESHPDISPNGQRIVFVRQDKESATSDNEIWVMDIDGENQERLTTNTVSDNRPVWSPDGTQIAFESDNAGSSVSIFVMNANGDNLIAITDNNGNDHSATWSADHTIAFISDRQGDSSADIYKIQEGTAPEILVDASNDNGINLFDPVWSPDGTQIAYQGYHSGGAAGIFIANADGSSAKVITSKEFSAYQPTWSPDGNYIAFVNLASNDNTDTIWITTTDGSSTFKLTDDQGNRSNFPSWGLLTE